MKYATYIITCFETEIEYEFSTVKKMEKYLRTDGLVRSALCVRCFSLDTEGYKELIESKFNKENL